MADSPTQADAESLLAFVGDRAAASCGSRCLAVYAIGSLAHGGFSSLASDVDTAIILQDPLGAEDAAHISAIADAARSRAFGDRLSIFWGTPSTLRGEEPGGRFPPHDLLDLARYGRLLRGTEQREHIIVPSAIDLLIASTEFALTKLAADTIEQLRSPAKVAAAGPRVSSKLVLFPVRFLYTAQTGEMGLNEHSVANYLATHSADDPKRALVAAALGWRATWAAGDPATPALLAHATLLYEELIADLTPRMESLGRRDLADGLTRWRRRLRHHRRGSRVVGA